MFLLVVVMQSLFSFVHKKNTYMYLHTVTDAYTYAQKHAEVYFSCYKYSVIDVMGHIAI